MGSWLDQDPGIVFEVHLSIPGAQRELADEIWSVLTNRWNRPNDHKRTTFAQKPSGQGGSECPEALNPGGAVHGKS